MKDWEQTKIELARRHAERVRQIMGEDLSVRQMMTIARQNGVHYIDLKGEEHE